MVTTTNKGILDTISAVERELEKIKATITPEPAGTHRQIPMAGGRIMFSGCVNEKLMLRVRKRCADLGLHLYEGYEQAFRMWLHSTFADNAQLNAKKGND